MRNIVLCLLLPVVPTLAQQASDQAGAEGPRIACPEAVWDFGRLPQHQSVEHEFMITNAGTGELQITRVIPTCSCTAVMPPKKVLRSGEETTVKTTLKTGTFRGKITKVISVLSNDSRKPRLQLTVTGEVTPPLYVTPARLSFGSFSKTESSKALPFEVVLSRGSDFEIGEVRSSSPLVVVTPQGGAEERADGSTVHRYTAQLRDGAPVGLLRETISVGTTSKTVPKSTVRITGEVAGEVRMSRQNLNFGACSNTEPRTRELVVTKSGDPDLAIEGVDVVPAGRFRAEVVTEEEGRRFRVRVSLEPGGEPGYVKGTITVRTNCPGEESVKAWFHAFVKRS